ncbi:MAG: class I SAM-dependent methyltransferase [Thermomicrobia bacterium]|nr:class I SAM-dependent methyltransferase [Thermomicrobia bacterium]MCA1724628.1 class I SAM-dependent methyltransferase [Thermomicrobia bacterium]
MTIIQSNISRQHGADPWLTPFLEAMRAAGETALELGCGPGEDAAELTAQGFRVAGFDVIRKPIRRAVVNAPAAHFFVADLQSPLPVRSGAVAIVVASLSIHYFAWRETLALRDEVRRVLQPGGVFVFRVNATDDVNFGALQGEEIEPHYYHVPPDGRNNRPYKRFFDDASIRALLTPDWRIAHLAHRTISRYDTPKQVWECLAYPE